MNADTPNHPVTSEQILAAVDDVRSRLESNQAREKLIGRLQDELDGHRQGQAERLLLPLLNGILRMHTDLGRLLEGLRREPEKLTPQRCLGYIQGFETELELVLDHAGVTLFVEPGTAFNPQRQIAQRAVPATDSAQVGQVAKRLRPGFEFSGRVVQKERVEVFAASAPADGK
jgi:molecular chaperone GrpE (heat shock protein)